MSDARVVHEDVDPPVSILDSAERFSNLRFVADIARMEGRGAAGIADGASNRACCRRVPIERGHGGPLLREQLRDRQPDARSRTGHDGNFIPESEHSAGPRLLHTFSGK
jgi:hypothetical protein